MSHDYEKLGAFYLGKTVDASSGERTDELLLLDSRDLTTHGVIIGMTGSGKTGLGLGLLEEAAIDRIPVIAIDPKGDLANLLLTFPSLAPSDFRPWINEEAARQKGVEPEIYAQQQAELWRNGLKEWGQDGERIRRLREHADFAVYTPGSAAGIPVALLNSFEAPPESLRNDREAYISYIQSMVQSLLGMFAISSDPVRSPHNVFLSTLLEHVWNEGRHISLAELIHLVQRPPFSTLGLMDLESAFPAQARQSFAAALNNALASLGFEVWRQGEPLDIGSFLYTPHGKPKVSIFSIAHLGDEQRMFFVTLLLNTLLAWTRSQPGTTTLRALLYMDEVFGFFPPIRHPPSKLPMLTLLKQARAYGVGVVLATQNPVDLDYKGLGNAGTWFIGRLQTDRDKMRVLEALDGAMAGSNPIPRADLDRMISGLGKRVFLMHSVHRGAPALFTTRWAMSYLAGPMTLAQISALEQEWLVTTSPDGLPKNLEPKHVGASVRPAVPSDIRQYFAPIAVDVKTKMYHPMVYLVADVRYAQARLKLDETRRVQLLVPLEDHAIPFDINRARATDLHMSDLDSVPLDGALYASLPSAANHSASYNRWAKELIRWIPGNQPLVLYESKAHKLTSRPGESEREFRIRLAEAAREDRDAQADRVRKKYESRFRTLEDRLRRAEQAVERKKGQSQQAMLNTGVAALGGLLGAMLGGTKRGQIGRASTAARGAGRVAQTRQEAALAGETVEAVRAQIAEVERELQEELRKFEDPAGGEEALEEVAVRPALNAISMRLVALAWVPEK